MGRIWTLIAPLIAIGVGIFLAFISTAYGVEDLLFDRAPWVILFAAFLGILVGAALRNRKPRITNGKVLRHDWAASLYHWTFALSGVMLLLTGFFMGFSKGFSFVPRVFNDPQTVAFLYNLHFVGAAFFAFGFLAHLTDGYVSGRIKEHMPRASDIKDAIAHYASKVGLAKKPYEGMYLASEKLSYPLWLGSIGLLGITGLIKVAAHIWNIPGSVMGVTFFLHDLGAFVFALVFIAHIVLGVIVPWSWPLFLSMVTGYVPKEYVKHHHPKWYDELSTKEGSTDIKKS